ncbi:DNA topoisomerase 6 subunit A [Orobanche hederae]
MADKGKRICADDDSDEKPDSLLFKYLLKLDSLLFKSKLESHSTIIQTLEAYTAATSSIVKSPTPAKLYPDVAYVDIGLVVGKLIFSEDGYTIDCMKMGAGGIRIPNIDRVGDMQSDALFILLVEKLATYMRLEKEEFYNRFPCIIVRAGQPDVAISSS